MKIKNLALTLGLMGATALVTASVVSQDKPAGEMPEWLTPEVLARMQPGEHHKKLDKFVGKWDQHIKHFAAPGSEPEVMTGTSEYKWILDGRILKGTYHGDMGGMAFEGIEFMGYDNMRNEYFSIWFDNMGTGFSVSRGQLEGNKMNMAGTMDDCMSGAKDVATRSVSTLVGDDKMKFEMFMKDPQGNENKVMEIVATKAK